MINRELLHVFNESIRIAKTRFTAWSNEATVTVATDPTVPSVPTIAAQSADQAVDLQITPPTTNTDLTPIVDLRDYTVYYSTSSGIDIANPATYSGTFNTTSTQHTFPTSAKTYFVCQCNDKWSNSSTGSTEVDATPTVASGVPVSVDDYSNNISQILVGKGIIGIIFQPPKSSWERWAGWKLYREDDGGTSFPSPLVWDLIYTGSGAGFLDKGTNGTLDESYHYMYKLVVLGEDGTVTSGTIKDNGADDGTGPGYQPNASDNSAVLASTIMAERIFALTELYAQDAVIGASGSLRSGQTVYNTGTGWWIGDVAGTAKLSMGNPAGNKLTWDGSTLTVVGNLTTNTVDVGTTGYIKGGATGYNSGTGFWMGYDATVHKLFIGNSAGAKLTWDGSTLTATSLVVGSGSTWGGDTLPDAKIPNLDCDKITSGTFGAVRIPSLDCDKITSGTFGTVRIPDLSAEKITTGGLTSTNWPTSGWGLDLDTGWMGCKYGGGYVFEFNATTGNLTINGALTCANLTVTGGSWGGDTLATAKIPNLDCNKITSGEFGTVRIPNLSAAKITSGTFDPVRIPNLSAVKITTGGLVSTNWPTSGWGMDLDTGYIGCKYGGSEVFSFQGSTGDLEIAGALTCANLTVTGGTWGGTAIGHGYIAANAVRTSELYLDGDLNFKPGASSHSIFNITNIGFGAYVGDKPQIFRSAGGKLNLSSVEGIDATSSGGYNLRLITLVGGDISLESSDDIILEVADASGTLVFKDWQNTGNVDTYANKGWLKWEVNGAVRYVRCFSGVS